MAQQAARRIDPYVQHLMRHRALGMTLESERPVTFRFQQGERAANNSLDHESVALLVKEAAPRSAIEQLSRGGRASFEYEAPGGHRVAVQVEARAQGRWFVSIVPADPADDGLELKLDAVSPQPSRGRVAPAPPPPAPESPAPLPAARAAEAAVDSPGKPGGTLVMAPAPQPAARAPSPAPAATPAARPAGTPPRIDKYLRRLMELGASDLHLSTGGVPMLRLDGEMRPFDRGQRPLVESELREMLYEIATPRAREHFDARNDADFAHSIEGLARFRANYFMDRKGMGAVFRQIPFDILPPDQLGLPKSVLDLCWLSKGLVLVTGPTGSGKSTTLASLIDYINRNRRDHVITIEDPIEFVHESKKCLVNQREVGMHTASFKSALRAALREDPDIVLVGEMRDLETIAIAIETAETGHLVFGTLHTTTAASTVDRIIDQFPADRQSQIRTMLSESLRAVIAQVLCKKIRGGRVAAYEILLANPAVANLIREAKSYQLVSVMQTGRTAGMQTMNEHLLELVTSKQVEAREGYVKSNDKAVFRELLQRAGIKLNLND